MEIAFKTLKSDLALEAWKTKSLFKQELDVRMLAWMASKISMEGRPSVSLRSMIQTHCVLLGRLDGWRSMSVSDLCESVMNNIRGRRGRMTESEKQEEILVIRRFLSFLSEEWITQILHRSSTAVP